MSRSWKKAEVNEALVVLYLRLNGYFTTGLVIHSAAWGEARTEIDCFAVRHPQHSQPERQVASSPFLALRRRLTDVLVCEVKSLPSQVEFNRRLREDRAVVQDVLCWGGLFTKRVAEKVARRLQPLLQNGVAVAEARRGVSEAGVRVRGLLCCPPVSDSAVPSVWCLTGTEILRFAHDCFNPAKPRSTCSTRYNFQLWGVGLAPIVEYFKALRPADSPKIEDLYNHVGAV